VGCKFPVGKDVKLYSNMSFFANKICKVEQGKISDCQKLFIDESGNIRTPVFLI
jgi:hypothetical protein